MKLKVRVHFDAAHRLEGYQGDCANLHGHRWELIGTFLPDGAAELMKDPVGIAVDFKALKNVMNHAVPDHEYLNDMEDLGGQNPTAENLVSVLADRIQRALKLQEIPAFLTHLELFESPTCSVEWEYPFKGLEGF